MSEASPSSPVEPGSETRKRNLIILFSLVPLLLLFALLGWALAQSGGNPGGFGINSRFGELAVEHEPAPDFVKEGLDGEAVSLSGLRGKVVMLDFWSSWCPPCRKEAPALAQVYRQYQDRNVEFVGLAIWDRQGKVDDFVQEFGLSYPNLIDDNGQIAIDYGVRGIPEKFFIDTDGNLVRKFVGPMDEDDLRAALEGLLAP